MHSSNLFQIAFRHFLNVLYTYYYIKTHTSASVSATASTYHMCACVRVSGFGHKGNQKWQLN